MPKIVAKFLELIEYHDILAGFPKLPALVEYLFDVAFTPWSSDNLTGKFLEPLEALLAHLLGQNGNGFTTKDRCVVRSPSAEIPR